MHCRTFALSQVALFGLVLAFPFGLRFEGFTIVLVCPLIMISGYAFQDLNHNPHLLMMLAALPVKPGG